MLIGSSTFFLEMTVGVTALDVVWRMLIEALAPWYSNSFVLISSPVAPYHKFPQGSLCLCLPPSLIIPRTKSWDIAIWSSWKQPSRWPESICTLAGSNQNPNSPTRPHYATFQIFSVWCIFTLLQRFPVWDSSNLEVNAAKAETNSERSFFIKFFVKDWFPGKNDAKR